MKSLSSSESAYFALLSRKRSWQTCVPYFLSKYVLQSVPHHTPLTWPTGIPKLVLYIGDRSSIKGIGKPFPIFASAWSVVTNSQGDRYQYAYWPFLVGTENYQKTILDATSIIKYYMAESALEPIFEFDYKYNWFSDQTPFTPDNIVDLYKSIKIKDKMKNRKEGTT